MNEERKQEFLRLKQKFGKVTPKEWGGLIRNYFTKYDTPALLAELDGGSKNFDDFVHSNSPKLPDLDDPTLIFNGKVLN